MSDEITPVVSDKSDEDVLKSLTADYQDASIEFAEPTPSDEQPKDEPKPSGESTDPEAPYGRFANGKPRKRPKKGMAVYQNEKDPVETVLMSDLISGALLITLIDLLLPMLLETINNAVSKVKIKASDLQMQADQRKKLEPIAEKLAKRWNIEAHPGMLLGIMLVSIYGMNFYAAFQSAKDEKTINTK